MSVQSDTGNYDAGDQGHVDQRKKLGKIANEKRVNGLKHCASTVEGRAWIWGFLEQASPLVTPFNAQSESLTAFNCGAKIMPVQILEQMLTHCPAEYYLMKSEAKERPETKPKEREHD